MIVLPITNYYMYKDDIVNSIATQTGATKISVESCLNSFMDVVMDSLRKGQDVNLIGFCSLKPVATKAKLGRNPRTGKEIKIPASKKVKFSAGKKLKDSVKGIAPKKAVAKKPAAKKTTKK